MSAKPTIQIQEDLLISWQILTFICSYIVLYFHIQSAALGVMGDTKIN